VDPSDRGTGMVPSLAVDAFRDDCDDDTRESDDGMEDDVGVVNE